MPPDKATPSLLTLRLGGERYLVTTSKIVKLDIGIDTRAIIHCVWEVRKLSVMVLSIFRRLKVFVAFEAIVIYDHDVHFAVIPKLLLERRGAAQRRMHRIRFWLFFAVMVGLVWGRSG